MNKVIKLFRLHTQNSLQDEAKDLAECNQISIRKMNLSSEKRFSTRLDITTKKDFCKNHQARQKTFRVNSIRMMTTRNFKSSKNVMTVPATTDIIASELMQVATKQQNQTLYFFETIDSMSQSLQQIRENSYNYLQTEKQIQKVTQSSEQLGSKVLNFICLTIAGEVSYLYGNYSSAIFYFDKCFKKLYCQNKNLISRDQDCKALPRHLKHKELHVYKLITKIFLEKNQCRTSLQFAYKFLRKCWQCKNEQEQLSAYDLLGKIYHGLENKKLSVFFHQKMTQGRLQQSEIVRLSNFELEKSEKGNHQFAVYEAIQDFTMADKPFHEMLEDRYKVQNNGTGSYIGERNSTDFFYQTHRSPNRNLRYYRRLERKRIEPKNSAQIHLIKPRQSAAIKKTIASLETELETLKKAVELKQNQNGRSSINLQSKKVLKDKLSATSNTSFIRVL